MARTVAEYKEDIARQREQILQIYLTHYPNYDTSRIEKAMDYAELLHRGQMRRSGNPYIFHPLAVTRLVAEAELDESCLISAILHDTIEDTVASKDVIADKFDPYISDLVQAMTKIKSYSAERREEDKRLTYKRILKAASKDIRPLLIKIYDRLNNMREMSHMPEGHRLRISRETLEVYVPLARRLGMSRVERELINHSLKYLYAKPYKAIKERLAKESDLREDEISATLELIDSTFRAQNIWLELVSAWPAAADFYQPNIGIATEGEIEVQLNLILPEIQNLYLALGIMHQLFTPVPLQIRDMVASPMANGFRALLTKVVIGGRIYRVSISTPEMYQVNQRGIVHNWKQNQNRLSGYYTNYMQILEELLADEEVRVDDVLRQSSVDGLAIFSPRKDLYILPEGSTVIDFAYEIHQQVGEHAKEALVNGVARPISHELKTGDVVRIITDSKVHPEKNWVDFAKSPKARSNINNWLRREMERRIVEMGRSLLFAELEKYGRDPLVVVESAEFKEILKQHKFKLDELYRRIGYRQIIASRFVRKNGIIPAEQIDRRKRIERQSIRDRLFNTLKSKRGQTWKFKKDDIFVKYARCCNPIFGDKVVGVLSEGKGVTVHRDICPNLKTIEADKRIEVEWDTEGLSTSALLNLHIGDRQGVMAKILNVVNKHGVNMSEFNAYTVGHEAFMKVRLDVNSQRELIKIVNDIRKIEEVISITREE